MLFDIFSRKNRKEKQTKRPTITADIHEKNSLILSELTSLGAEINLMPLKVGDYLINKTIIERKTYQDFISSLLSKRLVEQLKNMQQYEKKLLILEGKPNKEIFENSKLNPNAIKGMLLSLNLDYRVNLIQTKDEEETAQYLFLLAKQQLKSKTPITLHSRIPKNKQEQKQYILESFPNIGPKTAEKLLVKFKTLEKVFNATEEELKEILKNKTSDFKQLLLD